MMKLCECGCGRPTPLATRTSRRYRRGEPQRYILGHRRPPNTTGRRFSEEHIKRLRESHIGQSAWNKGKKCPQLAGANQGNWRGGYTKCVDCGVQTHSYKAVRCKSCAMKVARHGKRPSAEAVQRSADMRRGKPSPRRGIKRPDLGGPRCHLWRGGLTTEAERIRKSVEYKAWRRAVFERDRFTCTQCRTPRQPIHADHIKPFALFPALRFELSNGRTLCVPCHQSTPSYLNRWCSEDAANG